MFQQSYNQQFHIIIKFVVRILKFADMCTAAWHKLENKIKPIRLEHFGLVLGHLNAEYI